MKQLKYLFLYLLYIPTLAWGQMEYPKDYFAPPVKGVITLAGNFGEARSNHLHSGFDVRTGGKVGVPIYAIADGFVSRINIKAWGYGRALYIDHPNGYTSVYAHLKKFNKTIDSLTKSIQYADESFVIDTLVKDSIYVKKGELIAYSGNSGSSSGPHLHFEIRDTRTEEPINPYLFGYTIKDNVKPKIKSVAVYPIGDSSSINGRHKTKIMKTYMGTNTYTVGKEDTLTVNGDIGFGLDCHDRESGEYGRNAVYSIELKLGEQRIYYAKFDKFSFDKSRYVNAHIDYAEKQRRNAKIQKCYLTKNNQLGVCKQQLNDGIISFTDNKIHWVQIIVKDYSGNESIIKLKIRSTSKTTLVKKKTPVADSLQFDCFKDNTCGNENFRFTVPAYSLYEDVEFSARTTNQLKGTYSPLCHIHYRSTGLNQLCTLKIKAHNLPVHLADKAFIVAISKKGKRSYKGGTFENGWITTEVKKLGNFAIAVDTTKPKIRAGFKIADKNNINLKGWTGIKIKISDNLSGINTYHGTIDGKWVLFEYDGKSASLYYRFDDTIAAGKHTCSMEVTDNSNNLSNWTFEFLR